jgi:hypothetical protein
MTGMRTVTVITVQSSGELPRNRSEKLIISQHMKTFCPTIFFVALYDPFRVMACPVLGAS